MRFVEVNGQPGALFVDIRGDVVAAVSLDIADGQVQTLHAVSNRRSSSICAPRSKADRAEPTRGASG